jgi:hypothetical protein
MNEKSTVSPVRAKRAFGERLGVHHSFLTFALGGGDWPIEEEVELTPEQLWTFLRR